MWEGNRSVTAADTPLVRGWAIEAPRPQARASRTRSGEPKASKGNIVFIVPLDPAYTRRGFRGTCRPPAAADPFLVEPLSALPNSKNHFRNTPRRVAQSCQKIAVLKREEGIGRPLDLSPPSIMEGLYGEKSFEWKKGLKNIKLGI